MRHRKNIETREQALELAERRCRDMLDRTYAEALEMLDRGELHGTIAEVEVEMLRDMVGCFK